MQKFKLWHGVMLVICAAVMGAVSSTVVMGIGSLQLAKHSGHENYSYDHFMPQFYASTPSTTAEDVSIYCPGIRENDRIFLALVNDSATTNSDRFVDLTDSCYIQDDDTIRFSQALVVTSEMLIGWQRINY
jgi:hypothetical protein